MGVRQIPTSPLHPKIRFACTDHPITIWARAILLRLYFELIGLRAAPDTVAHAIHEDFEQSNSCCGRAAGLVGLALGAERF